MSRIDKALNIVTSSDDSLLLFEYIWCTHLTILDFKSRPKALNTSCTSENWKRGLFIGSSGDVLTWSIKTENSWIFSNNGTLNFVQFKKVIFLKSLTII